jgi:DNA-directed RNA polymerase subunit F
MRLHFNMDYRVKPGGDEGGESVGWIASCEIHPAAIFCTMKKSKRIRKSAVSSEEPQRPDRYLELMNFSSPEEAYERVKELASGLSDNQHLIRSCIFDLHAAIELELRRILYHTFKAQLFLTSDEKKNSATIAEMDKMIRRLSFMDMYRILRPVLESWPYGDFQSIGPLNDARNTAAHGDAVDKVLYKGRNPFMDADCFAQMYFDVWAVQQGIAKFFDRVVDRPSRVLKRYVEKYGTGLL